MTPLRVILSLSTFHFYVPLSMPLPSRFSTWFFHPLDYWHLWFTLSENFCLCWQARVLFSLVFLLFSCWYTQQLVPSLTIFLFIHFFFIVIASLLNSIVSNQCSTATYTSPSPLPFTRFWQLPCRTYLISIKQVRFCYYFYYYYTIMICVPVRTYSNKWIIMAREWEDFIET